MLRVIAILALPSLLSGCVAEEHASSARGSKIKATLRTGTSLCLPVWGCDHVQSLVINGVEKNAHCAAGNTDPFLSIDPGGTRLLYECGSGKWVLYVEGTSIFEACEEVQARDWSSIPGIVTTYPNLLHCNDKIALVTSLTAHGITPLQILREELARAKDPDDWLPVYDNLTADAKRAVAEDLRKRVMECVSSADLATFNRLFLRLLEPQKAQARADILSLFKGDASEERATVLLQALDGAPPEYGDAVVDALQTLGTSLPANAPSLVSALHTTNPDDPRVRNIACTNLAKLGVTALRVLAESKGARCASLERALRENPKLTCERPELVDHALENNGAVSSLFASLRARRAYELQEATSLYCENGELPRGAKCHCGEMTYCESLLASQASQWCRFVVDDAHKRIVSVRR